MAYWTAFFPADVIKSRLQTDAKLAGKSFSEVFLHLFRTEGFRALYKVRGVSRCHVQKPRRLRSSPARLGHHGMQGWGITVARAMPSNAVLFVTYEFVAKQFR